MPLPMLSPPVAGISLAPSGTVDIAIVIDTSTSMSDEAERLSDAAEAALESAQRSCPCDARILWFGVKGVRSKTKFERDLTEYLKRDIHIPEDELHIKTREDGAAAIQDLANYLDWRPGARRVVFFLGDEALQRGGQEVDAADIKATQRAILAAKAQHVRVYTYLGTGGSDRQDICAEYAELAQKTGGKGYTDRNQIPWDNLLKDIICSAQTAVHPYPNPSPPMNVSADAMMCCIPMMMPIEPGWGRPIPDSPQPWITPMWPWGEGARPGFPAGRNEFIPGPPLEESRPTAPGTEGPPPPHEQEVLPVEPNTTVLELAELVFHRRQHNNRWTALPSSSVQHHLPAELRSWNDGPSAALLLSRIPSQITVELELAKPLNRRAHLALGVIFVPIDGGLSEQDIKKFTAACQLELHPSLYHARLRGAAPSGTEVVDSPQPLFLPAGVRRTQTTLLSKATFSADPNQAYVALLWGRPMCGLHDWSVRRLTFHCAL